MNQSTSPLRIFWLPVCTLLLIVTTSCQDHQPPLALNTTSYSADVVTSWLTMQLKITRTAPAPPMFTGRRFAYTGIALYESIVPGLAGYQSIAPQLNGLPPLPTVTSNLSYYWPACANAALAAMNRSFHPTTAAANKIAIDSLETATTALYQKDRPADELARSAEFGKKIAAAVFEWSKSDGNDNNSPYTLPIGVGLWVPTPPAFAPAAVPNWGAIRPIVPGSDTGADQNVPTPYSPDPASAYYAQVKDVYDLSQRLTPEQRTIALYWAGSSDGKSFGGGQWLSILSQVLAVEKPKLEVAAVAFAQLGIAGSEAAISIFKQKYQYNGLRPITYIRTVMNQPTWNALLDTPNQPEYPSGHAVTSAAAAQTLTLLFGTNYKFTDNSNALGGYSPRSYNSFEEAAIEAGNSRVYGGIHYRKTCDMGQIHGKIIAQNVAQRLKFKR